MARKKSVKPLLSRVTHTRTMHLAVPPENMVDPGKPAQAVYAHDSTPLCGAKAKCKKVPPGADALSCTDCVGLLGDPHGHYWLQEVGP